MGIWERTQCHLHSHQLIVLTYISRWLVPRLYVNCKSALISRACCGTSNWVCDGIRWLHLYSGDSRWLCVHVEGKLNWGASQRPIFINTWVWSQFNNECALISNCHRAASIIDGGWLHLDVNRNLNLGLWLLLLRLIIYIHVDVSESERGI